MCIVCLFLLCVCVCVSVTICVLYVFCMCVYVFVFVYVHLHVLYCMVLYVCCMCIACACVLVHVLPCTGLYIFLIHKSIGRKLTSSRPVPRSANAGKDFFASSSSALSPPGVTAATDSGGGSGGGASATAVAHRAALTTDEQWETLAEMAQCTARLSPEDATRVQVGRTKRAVRERRRSGWVGGWVLLDVFCSSC